MPNYNTIDRLYEFRSEGLRHRSLVYIGWLLLMLCLSSAVFMSFKGASYGAIKPSLFVYYLIAGVHIIRRMRNSTSNILAPDIVYVVVYTLFHLAYITIYALGLVHHIERIFHFDSSIPSALHVVNLGLIGFLVGYEILGKKNADFIIQAPVIKPTLLWEYFAIILMVSSVVLHLVGLMAIGPDLIKAHGYEAIQNVHHYSDSYLTSLLISMSPPLMSFGVVLYVLASSLRYNKLFHSKFAFVIYIFFLVLVMLEGNRTEGLMLGIPVVLIRHYIIKKYSLVSIGIISLSAMAVFSIIGLTRQYALDSEKMIDEFNYVKTSEDLQWQTPFIEIGGSLQTVIITCGAVPGSEPYWRGASWRDSLFHVVPFLQRFTLKNRWSTWAPSEWLTVTFFGTSASGKGFTVAAEGYLNFGYPGAFFELMIAGMFIRWLYVRFASSPSAFWGLVFLGCFGPCIIVIRNHVNLVTNVIAQVFVLGWILNAMLGNEEYQVDEYEDINDSAKY